MNSQKTAIGSSVALKAEAASKTEAVLSPSTEPCQTSRMPSPTAQTPRKSKHKSPAALPGPGIKRATQLGIRSQPLNRRFQRTVIGREATLRIQMLVRAGKASTPWGVNAGKGVAERKT